MKAKDVMSCGAVWVRETAPLEDAVRAMLTNRISGMPVKNDAGHVVGMISEGDLLRRAELATEPRRPKWLAFLLGAGRLSAEYAHTHGRFVSEVMTRNVVSVDEETELSDVVQLMQKHDVKRLPVLRDGRLMGIVSRADLLRALDGILERGTVAPKTSDRAIRAAILAELERQTWAPTATIHVSVQDGAVRLAGSILDERERDALRVLCENIPGVRSVKDDMVLIQPYAEAFIAPFA